MASPRARPPQPRPPAPHPLAEPLHRAALHLLRLLRRADDASGVSPARLSALSVLVFGGPCTLGALAAAEGVSAPTMSRLVAELEREGYLRRRIDRDDARRAQLDATAKAQRLLHAGRTRRLEALGAALATLDRTQRAALPGALAALEAVNRALATQRTPRPSGGDSPARARRRFD